jgi:hypothetical protein
MPGLAPIVHALADGGRPGRHRFSLIAVPTWKNPVEAMARCSERPISMPSPGSGSPIHSLRLKARDDGLCFEHSHCSEQTRRMGCRTFPRRRLRLCVRQRSAQATGTRQTRPQWLRFIAALILEMPRTGQRACAQTGAIFQTPVQQAYYIVHRYPRLSTSSRS